MTQHRDIHQEITDKIVEAIETGLANPSEWECPWSRSQAAGLPRNAVTGADYNGMNILNLWVDAMQKGYQTNLWASFKQWQQRGAQVRKGERGSVIVFYKSITRETGETTASGEPGSETFRVLKYSTVFNADQVDGFDVVAPERPALAERLARAEEFVAYTRAQLKDGGQRAYYAPELDYIGMPALDLFRDSATATATENYYSTLLHELTHWTGHASRCDRDFGKRFGNDSYAAEELVAELGAAFLCGELAITGEPRADHGHYLAHWLRVLKDDKRAIFTAAAKASEAAGYLRSLQPAVRQLEAA